MKKLNTYLFKKALKKEPENNNTRFVNYNKARKIVVLFDFEKSKYATIFRPIIESMEKDGKTVTAWAYYPDESKKKPLDDLMYSKLNIYSNLDVGFTKKPNKELIENWSSQSYDLLIDLSCNDDFPLLYFALYTDAKCKAGVKKTALLSLDFMLDIGKIDASDSYNEKAIFDKLIFYLKSIQTSD